MVNYHLPAVCLSDPVLLKAKETHGVLRAAVHRLLADDDEPIPAAFNRIKLTTRKIRAVKGRHYIDMDFAGEDAI